MADMLELKGDNGRPYDASVSSDGVLRILLLSLLLLLLLLLLLP